MTGFPYRYVGGIGVEVRGEKRPKKTESVFRFRVCGATEKPALKSQGKKNDRKKTSRFFGFGFIGQPKNRL